MKSPYVVFHELNPYASHTNKDVKKGMYPYIPSGLSASSLADTCKEFERIHKRKAKTFLDLGCGKGGVLYTALGAGLIPTGVEISSELLSLARKIQKLEFVPNSDKITFIKGDILKWEPTKQYDIVYFYHPLEDENLHKQFIKHIHEVFPLGQTFIALGGVANHTGFKRADSLYNTYISINRPTEYTTINGLPIVGKFNTKYIFGRNGVFYAATIEIDDMGNVVPNNPKRIKFQLTETL